MFEKQPDIKEYTLVGEFSNLLFVLHFETVGKYVVSFIACRFRNRIKLLNIQIPIFRILTDGKSHVELFL